MSGKTFLEFFVRGELIEAREVVESLLSGIVLAKLLEQKKILGASLVNEARIRRIRIRVRQGKIQRRKIVSNVKGFKMQGGRLKRMTAKEKLDRKRGQRRGRIKRRAERARIRLHMKRSLRRRHALGLK